MTFLRFQSYLTGIEITFTKGDYVAELGSNRTLLELKLLIMLFLLFRA